MRWLPAVCLLLACAGAPRTAEPPQRVQVNGDDWTVAYRLVLGAPRLEGHAQIWNRTATDWVNAKLTLATVANSRDRDGDKIADSADLCPGDREDVDGHHDEDGCPEPDNDSDRILDDTDRCPNEPETYNGDADDDGCPDRGTIEITSHGGGIIDWVYFPTGSAVVKPVSFPIIDAIAATIVGNPQLRRIEISGHADRTERDPWSLSVRRAAAVRARLIAQGVDASRLSLGPYAALQPQVAGSAASDLARNRRAGFTVVERDDVAAIAPVPPAFRPPFDRPPPERIDDLRYDLAQPVTLGRRESTTLAILDKPVDARRILLYQPDPEIASSDVHPFRATRVINTTGFVLQRGPIEITDGDQVVERAVLRRLGIGDTAWLPTELDRTTRVVAATRTSERPLRIVSGDRGSLVVENLRDTGVAYTITASAAAQLELHHRRLPDHTLLTMPSVAVESADRLIVTRDLAAGATTTIEVVEQQRHRVNRRFDQLATAELGEYIAGSSLPPAVGEALRMAHAHRSAADAHLRTLTRERTRLGEVVTSWQQTGKALDGATRLRLEEIGRAIADADAALAGERAALDAIIAKLPTW